MANGNNIHACHGNFGRVDARALGRKTQASSIHSYTLRPLSYRGLARFSADDTSINLSNSEQDLSFVRYLGEGSLADVLKDGNGSGFLHSIPMSFVYLIGFAIFFGIVLHRSVFGRYIFAA